MKIKELLKKEKISQTDFVKKLDISRKTLTNYLNGSTEPTMSSLIKIANYFDVSLDYLCERQYNNNVGYIPDERKEAVRTLISLSDSNFKEIENILDNLKRKDI